MEKIRISLTDKIGFIHIDSRVVKNQDVIDHIDLEIDRIVRDDKCKIIDLESEFIFECNVYTSCEFSDSTDNNSHKSKLNDVIRDILIGHIENDCSIYVIYRNNMLLRELIHSNSQCKKIYNSELSLENRLDLADFDNKIYNISKFIDNTENIDSNISIDEMKRLIIGEYNEYI